MYVQGSKLPGICRPSLQQLLLRHHPSLLRTRSSVHVRDVQKQNATILPFWTLDTLFKIYAGRTAVRRMEPAELGKTERRGAVIPPILSSQNVRGERSHPDLCMPSLRSKSSGGYLNRTFMYILCPSPIAVATPPATTTFPTKPTSPSPTSPHHN